MDYELTPDLPVKHITVEPDGHVAVHEHALTGGDLRDHVLGGDYESIPVPDTGALIMFANASGKERGLGYNWSATRHCRQMLHPSDFIVGPVVVVGPADEQGRPTNISDEVIDMFREAKR